LCCWNIYGPTEVAGNHSQLVSLLGLLVVSDDSASNVHVMPRSGLKRPCAAAPPIPKVQTPNTCEKYLNKIRTRKLRIIFKGSKSSRMEHDGVEEAILDNEIDAAEDALRNSEGSEAFVSPSL
jgi:hypothetical protein